MTQSQIAFTAPHWAATEAGMSILQEGGTATEAMVAAAAVISVVYPHMNSIGGDGFWLVHEQGAQAPLAIDACGRSPGNIESYRNMAELPNRGGKAAITQAGTVRGWQEALAQDSQAKLPLSRLLRDAIKWCDEGVEVTASLQAAIDKVSSDESVPESFKALYAPNGQPLQKGDKLVNADLAATFRTLVKNGLDDFYHGEVAKKITATLTKAGSSLTAEDIANTQADVVEPLTVKLENIRCFNLPAPTQGVHSLQILSIVDHWKDKVNNEAEWAHLIVEATKQSFADRSELLTDPAFAPQAYFNALTEKRLQEKSAGVDLNVAKPWPFPSEHGDTVWMGACDSRGQLVSFIQSIYWEFGCAEVIEGAGFVWNNRGISFSLDESDVNKLEAKKRPRHTLNPAMALFDNGKRLSYGTMGGEGQPQTQATLFSRHVWQEKPLEEAINQGRWLLGRTWGDNSNDLKVESDIAETIGDELTAKGHVWQTVPSANEMMGHAGAIADVAGNLEAATDKRSDGKASVENF